MGSCFQKNCENTCSSRFEYHFELLKKEYSLQLFKSQINYPSKPAHDHFGISFSHNSSHILFDIICLHRKTGCDWLGRLFDITETARDHCSPSWIHINSEHYL